VIAFRYRAVRADGERIVGRVSAGNATEAASDLGRRGLLPLEVREERQEARIASFGSGDLAQLLSGLAALLEAGLPVDRALATAGETAAPVLRELLAAAHDAVRQGARLSVALEGAGRLPPMVTGLVRSGEQSGRLAAAVARAAAELERTAELRAQVRAALTYPVFLTAAGTVAVATIVGFVLPRFAALLGDLGQALPASTRLLLGAAALAHRQALLLLVLAVAVAAAIAVAAQTAAARLAWHRWLLDMPVVGPMRHGLSGARFCRSLAGLLETGVPLLAALDAARDAAGDLAVAERVTAARGAVNEGERLAVALRREAALLPSALRLVAFGEHAGRLPAFLERAAQLDERAAQRSLRALVALIEPVLIVGFGAVVAFVAAALLQAVYSVRPGGF